jgi:hypothetical protein
MLAGALTNLLTKEKMIGVAKEAAFRPADK